MANPITSPSGTIGGVYKDIDGFGKAVIQSVAINQQEFLLMLWDEVIAETPRFSGTLMAGWVMQVNTPSKFIPPLKREEGYYDYPGQPDLLRYKRIWKKTYLTNNVPYIGFVNDGVSGNEANFGFVDRSIQNAIDRWSR